MFEVITSYTFIVVAIGTVLLGFSSGMVGTVSVLKGQSLIGDAIGHSSFPGIVLAFMLFQSRTPWMLMLGALITGAIAFALVQGISAGSKIKLDTSLAVVLSSMFGLGMVLKSYITGHPAFSGAAQSGLQTYIFGQAAYMLEKDVILVSVVSIFALIILFLFYKELQLYIFDPLFAHTARFRPKFMSVVVLIMTMSLITAGLKAVGAILISSMLITPAIIGLQWSNKYKVVIWVAGLSGAVSAFIGTYISTIEKGMATGPTIIVVMSILAIISIVIGPNGALATARRRRKGNE